MATDYGSFFWPPISSGGGGVTDVFATAPLASSGGDTPNISISGAITINHGGTGQTTANAALNALLPDQTGNSGKFLTTDGSDSSWATSGGGGGSPAGSDTQVQYNDTGSFGASAQFTFDSGSGALRATELDAYDSVNAIPAMTITFDNLSSYIQSMPRATNRSRDIFIGPYITGTTGSGANVDLRAGASDSGAGGHGGQLTLGAGDADSAGDNFGGQVQILGGQGYGTHDGGDVSINGGAVDGSGKAGSVTLTGYKVTSASPIVLPNYIVADLPSASAMGAGALAFVTDSTTTIILGLGLTVVGTGSNKVPVYSDGTNWIIG